MAFLPSDFDELAATEQRSYLIEYNNKCETKQNRLSCTVKLIEHLIILVSEWCCRCRVFFLYLLFFFLFSSFCFVIFFLLLRRLNNIQVQNDFLKQIPRMAEITLPTNYVDWKSKQLSLPINIKGAQITSPPGRRDRGFSGVEEPHYVLVRGDGGGAEQRHLGITCHLLSDFYRPSRTHHRQMSWFFFLL